MARRLSLLAFLVILSMTAWISMTYAYGETPCEAACEAEHEQCVNVCAEHSNPAECDSQCREQLEKCTRACH